LSWTKVEPAPNKKSLTKSGKASSHLECLVKSFRNQQQHNIQHIIGLEVRIEKENFVTFIAPKLHQFYQLTKFTRDISAGAKFGGHYSKGGRGDVATGGRGA